MTKRELRRAAWLLKESAELSRNSYMDWNRNEWIGDPEMGYTAEMARAEHDEALDLSRKLYALARTPCAP